VFIRKFGEMIQFDEHIFQRGENPPTSHTWILLGLLMPDKKGDVDPKDAFQGDEWW